MTVPTSALTRCTFAGKGCGRSILFVMLTSGKSMPVDPEVDPDGTVAVFRDAAGTWMGRVLRDGELPDRWERRHVTHFATCPAKIAMERRAKAIKAARAGGAAVLDDYRGRRGRR